MPVTIFTATTIGLEGRIIQVEVDISAGLPAFNIVGLADTAVLEARERVRSALKNNGYTFPANRKTVSLAPSDVRKHGPAFDVPIAIGILAASKQIRIPPPDMLLLGELSLKGELRAIPGMIPLIMFAKKSGMKSVIVPHANAADASIIEGIEILPAHTIIEVADHIDGKSPILPHTHSYANLEQSHMPSPDPFENIIGQYSAKRALCIAAAGHHNILLSGPPGIGKTLLAHALSKLLPPLSQEQFLDVAAIHSLRSSSLASQELLFTYRKRPIRQVHHTASVVSMIGGSHDLLPGEISLAHHGVLVLDELPEFGRHMLESLRQPLEDKTITITRAVGTVTYPANFLLFATANPCPCGMSGTEKKAKQCTCTPHAIQNYEKRISGPILDRIDLQVNMESVDSKAIIYQKNIPDENIKDLLARITHARSLRPFANSEITTRDLFDICPLTPAAQKLLTKAADNLHFSARTIHRIIKVSRTIADLDMDPTQPTTPNTINSPIHDYHVKEALQFKV